MKMSKFGTKSASFGYFWARILKNYCHIWNQHLRISVIAKFCEEMKMPKFGTKYAFFWYFWPRMPYWGISRQEFRKFYCHVWNHHLQICLFAKFHGKTKCLNLEPKMPDFGSFGLEFENQHPRICLLAKFCGKTKMPKFGTKNAIFGYFWPKMPYLGIFGLEFQKCNCPIWNQHPQISLIAKFCEKTKISKFGTKNAFFGFFWART